MLSYPTIDPVAIALGPVNVHWYGLMYLVGLVGGALLGLVRSKELGYVFRPQQVWDLLFFVVIGVIVGGRLGYVVFYNLEYYLSHPIELMFIWTGGMSFHGGLLGIGISIIVFSKLKKINFLALSDLVSTAAPIGLFFGRIANFINSELYGKITSFPIAMIFPTIDYERRHPSQLYEALFEGI